MVGVITLSNALAALPYAKYERKQRDAYKAVLRSALGDRKECSTDIGYVSPLAARAYVERAIDAITAELSQ